MTFMLGKATPGAQMLGLADPLDRIESLSSSTEETRHDRFVCDLEHNIQVESPLARSIGSI